MEDPGTLDRLLGLGCNSALGFHVCPPIVAADLTPWLRHSAWGVADRIPPRRMQPGTRSIQGTPDLSGRQGRGKNLPDGADVCCKDRMIPFQALALSARFSAWKKLTTRC